MACWNERFEELCALLQRNDGRITRLTTFNGLNGSGRRLGEALWLGNNTTVTHLMLCLDDVLAPQDDTTESATPLLLYLQSSSTALQKVEISTSFEHAQASNLTHLVLQALARNTNALEVDVSGIPFMSSNDLALFISHTTSCKSLIFNDQQLQLEEAALRRVATAFGDNNTLQHVTIFQRDSSDLDFPERIPGPDPILLQLGTMSSLKSLCLVKSGSVHHFAVPHFEAMASVPATTGALEYLELVGYTFNKPTLEPVLHSLKRNATVQTLCLKHCQMDEDATADFVQFVQRDCNTGPTSVLKKVLLKTSCGRPTFYGNVGNVSATMLIGSSVECLHLCQPPPCPAYGQYAEFNQHAADMVAFFEILAQHEAMVQLANLRLEYLNTEGANALYRYLSQSTSLRHLTVSALDRDVTSIPFAAALRNNGSLYSVSIQRVPLVDDISPSQEPSAVHLFSRRGDMAGEPPLPQSLFSVAEQSRIDAYITRNRMMSSIFERPLIKETNADDNDVVVDDNAGQWPLPWTMLPNLFGSAQAVARLAPHWTLHGMQQHSTSTSTATGDETLDPSRKSTKRLL